MRHTSMGPAGRLLAAVVVAASLAASFAQFGSSSGFTSSTTAGGNADTRFPRYSTGFTSPQGNAATQTAPSDPSTGAGTAQTAQATPGAQGLGSNTGSTTLPAGGGSANTGAATFSSPTAQSNTLQQGGQGGFVQPSTPTGYTTQPAQTTPTTQAGVATGVGPQQSQGYSSRGGVTQTATQSQQPGGFGTTQPAGAGQVGSTTPAVGTGQSTGSATQPGATPQTAGSFSQAAQPGVFSSPQGSGGATPSAASSSQFARPQFSAPHFGLGAAPTPAPATAPASAPAAPALPPGAAAVLQRAGLISNATGPAAAAAPGAAGVFNESRITGVGPVFKKQDSLNSFYANLYGIPTNGAQPDPDIFITLEALGGPANLGLYCNPGWGQYADVNNNYPQPGFAIWQSDLANGVDTVFISKNDKMYRPPLARDPNTTAYKTYQPYFICSVINQNQDSQQAVTYRMEADLIANSGALVQREQKALGSIFQKCCGGAASCLDWKAQNMKNASAGVYTDFCSFPGQICTANGTLLRLDLRGFNLGCVLPKVELATFTSLSTLNLGRNANLTGALADVFDAVAGAKNLRNLNLFRDAGLGGPLAGLSSPGGAPPSICYLAHNNLATLNLEGASAQGGIPPCLLGAASKLVELHLGDNFLAGPIPDVVGTGSNLQVLTAYNNLLSGTIPASLGNATQLTNLDLTNNTLGGTIPASLGNLSQLKYAVLKYNNLTGGIPAALATSDALETLDVKGNQLARLPLEWTTNYTGAANASLINVRLSFNNFSGPFPQALAYAPTLTFLVINNNSFSGPLPNITNGFQALRAFNGSHNAFSGPIPAAFGDSGIFTLAPLQFADSETMAHVFDLSYNQLTGKLPAFLNAANVPSYVSHGVLLQNNKLAVTCNAQTSYLTGICSGTPGLFGAASGPAAAVPVGTPVNQTIPGIFGILGTGTAPGATTALPPGASTPAVSTGGLPPKQATAAPALTVPNPSAPGANRSATVPVQANGQPIVIGPPAPQSGSNGLSPANIIGIIVGVVAVIALAAIAALAIRGCRRGSGRSATTKPSGGFGGLGSIGSGSTNGKFQRFNDGLEMSDSRPGTRI